ncbi:MAG: hypothetical protein AABX89_04765 [Candidatus Thermoplasmatota archaeon]
MTVTFWGRKGDKGTLDAVAFLKVHGYRANRMLDVDATPPEGADAALLGKSGIAPDGDGRWPAPLFLTPRGALSGFREQKWCAFLDIGKGRS